MILMFGPAGAGKSLQGQILAARHGWQWISVGAVLREQTDLAIKETLAHGDLLPGEVTNRLVAERLDREADLSGVILDGYPRSLDQAEALVDYLKHRGNGAIDVVIVLDVGREEILRRLEKNPCPVRLLKQVAALGACTVLFSRGNTKSYKRNGKILKIFRFGVRAASLVMSVFALSVTYTQGAEISLDLAVRTVVAIVSVISIILSLIPLIFGGLGGVARWLLSPTKVNKRFSAVALEWYGYASGASPAFASTNKVEVSRLEDIGRCVDSYILPALGRRKLSSVGVNQIFAAIDMAAPSDRSTVEGILKIVFDYAVECKYIASNPCRDLNLQGTIEVYEKPKKESLKVRIGKKIGSSIIKQFLGEDDGKK